MIKNSDEVFDELVERFLKKQLSQEEEEAFKKELAKNPEKLMRAQLIALAIKNMRNTSKEKDSDVIKAIKDTPQDSVNKIIDGTFYDDFDTRVEKFMKGQMTPEEEQFLKDNLVSSPELLSRAKTMGLAALAIRNNIKNKDSELIEAIKRTDSKTLEHIATQKTKRIIRPMIFRWSVGIAASLLILFSVSIRQYNIYQVKMIGNQYGNEFMTISLTKDRSGKQDSSAVAELSSLLGMLQNKDSISYAVIRLENIYNEYPKTIGNKDDWYMAYVSWHLSIAYLKMGKKKEALPLLKNIIVNYEGTTMAKKASEILKNL